MRKLHGVTTPTKTDVERLDELKGSKAGTRAVIFGNGWRLQFLRGFEISDPRATGIAVNRALEVIDAPVHVHIDMSGQAPPEYEGIRFGAAREHRLPGTLGAYWSDYWKRNGSLIADVNPPFSGLYAIEVAAFLGCSEIYLAGFCGDDRPGTAEGHFYTGRRCAPGLAEKHNAWMAAVKAKRPDLTFHALTIKDQGRPRVNAVQSFIDIEESGLFCHKEKP